MLGRIAALVVALAAFVVSTTAFGSDHESVPGEYIVKLKDGAEKTSLFSLQTMFNANEVRPVTEDNKYLVVRRPMHELQTNALQTLSNNPAIEYAEPNYIIRLNNTPNDPGLTELWGLINNQKQGVDVDAARAWQIQTGSKDVVVAVIDTGIDYRHQDLAENMWVNQAELNGTKGVDDDGNGYVDDIYGYDFANNDGDPLDDHSHGTHCAGTIGAKGNNGVGVVGVNWDVSLMAIKFLTAQGGGSLENAIKSIDYARINKADIMSNSWGGGGHMKSLEDAIIRAKDAGILFIAAAGNETNNNDSRPTYPATYLVDNVMSVAAIDINGELASFSNWGKTTVHVGAPGKDIYSTILNNQYKKYSGTSMATPHVAGIAALLKANEPDLTYLQIKERIMETAKPLSGLRGRTVNGLANAYKALINEAGGVDPDDPAGWQKADFSLSSPHPYDNSFTQTYEVSVPGAKKLAVFFERFETEYRFDILTVKDVTGRTVGSISGNNSQTWSPAVDGDTMILEFKSDSSINGYGFDISKVAFIPEESGEAPVEGAHQ